MALSRVSLLYISKSPDHLQRRSKPLTIVSRIEPQRENCDRESRKWQRLVSAALAAAVVTLSPIMPAAADINSYEVETKGEFGTGSAALLGSANTRRANFSGSTFHGASLEKAYDPNLTGSDAPRARPYKMILHPSTGFCVVRKSLSEPLELGSCSEADSWAYTPQKNLKIKGTYFCIQAVALGKPAKLSIICTEPGSNWEMISDSKTYLSTKLGDGTIVCLDVDSNNQIVTNSCKFLRANNMSDPGSQWFKIADSIGISLKPIFASASSILHFILQPWITTKGG